MISLVYLIQCDEDSERLERLFRLIYSDKDGFLLHVDTKATEALKTTASRLAAAFKNVRILQSRMIGWGGISQIELFMEGLAEAEQCADAWTHFIPLSADHLPLVSRSKLVAALQPDRSYIQYTGVGTMSPGARNDVQHRFSAKFKELPGWGPFAAGDRILTEQDVDDMYHGSSWFILCRAHADKVRENWLSDSKVVHALKHSVQPDETSIQSLLLAMGEFDGSIVNKCLTFVAYPHLSGTNDLTFTERNYVEAPGSGYFFIRKTPNVLPDFIQQIVENRASIPKSRLDDRLRRAQSGSAVDGHHAEDIGSLLDQLRAEVQSRAPSLAFDFVEPMSADHVPKLHIRLRDPNWSDGLAVVLISGDLRNFKTCVLDRTLPVDDMKPRSFSGWPTHVVKARLAGGAHTREYVDERDQDWGFFRLDTFNPAAIAERIASAARFAREVHESRP